MIWHQELGLIQNWKLLLSLVPFNDHLRRNTKSRRCERQDGALISPVPAPFPFMCECSISNLKMDNSWLDSTTLKVFSNVVSSVKKKMHTHASIYLQVKTLL